LVANLAFSDNDLSSPILAAQRKSAANQEQGLIYGLQSRKTRGYPTLRRCSTVWSCPVALS